MTGNAKGRSIRRGVFVVLPMLAGSWTWSAARADLPYENEPISYLTAPVDDPVARLQKRLDKGEVELKYDEEHGYLKSVLEYLKVPVSSQALVFSKTSFQRDRISPRAPRAIYFGDDTYVGWVKGGDFVEISTVDPKQGGVYYLLHQEKEENPTFLRQTHDCLQCHSSSNTQGVPGHLVRSVHPLKSGQPAYNAGTYTTSQESPLEHRWGGWYVTGQHGDQRHMGNVFVTDRDHPERLDTSAGANRLDLKGLVKTEPYLSPHSDIVALMVLEHQTQMHNFLTVAGYQARMALHYQEGLNKSLNEPAGTLYDSTRRRIEHAAEDLVRYMLFTDEAKLTAPVEGTSPFTAEFAAAGPRDKQGRSLRDFDLTTRLFKYPCSYLIYSEAFDALPAPTKDYVYRRLREILNGADKSSAFAHLTADDRRAIFEILRDTKPGLPPDWDRPPAG